MNKNYKDYCKKSCEITKSYKSLKPIVVLNDGSYSYYTIKAPDEPYWKTQSNLINNSKITRGKKIFYSQIKLNEYGSFSGAPYGYGMPPRNNFI
jgi:hypothetical protein